MQTATPPLPAVPENEEASALSQVELLACARLLAVSVAEHRAKFGVIPIKAHFEPGRSGASAAAPWTDPARAAFHEALDLIRVKVPTKASPDAAQVQAAHEKRRQLRISVSTPVQVSAADDGQSYPAMLRNISWGGAALRCEKVLGELNDRVRLQLPAGRGAKIDILATIRRVQPCENGSEYGLRFDCLSTEDEARLEKVLEILVSGPQQDGRRSEVRLVQRLEIEYGDAGELRATLEDISASGLMLTVPEALEIDQSLLIALTSTDTDLGLNLRARVVHQTRVDDGGLEMYRVGLQFEHPGEQLQARVSAVIQQLAVLRPNANWCEVSFPDPAFDSSSAPAAPKAATA